MITINIPSQLPSLTGNSLLYLRVNAGENGVEWAATAGGGITIGTSAISSGTVNRILFEGAGNVVQQDSAFVWNNTDKRLILGTEAVADTNSRLVVIGKGTGTNTTFAVHNSTGTNNALVVRDDSWIRFGAPSFSTIPLANQQWEFGAGAGRKVLTIQGNNSSAQPSFIRFQIDDGTNANKSIIFDNNNGVGGLGTAIRSIGSAPSQLFIEYQANNTEQLLEVRDQNSSGRALLAAGNNRARLVLTRAGTIGIGLYDTNADDSFWNPTGVRTFIFGATTRTNASAIVEIQSTTRGFLPPRMTAAQRAAISSPANGLMVIQEDGGAGVEGLYRYQSSTAAWVRIG